MLLESVCYFMAIHEFQLELSSGNDKLEQNLFWPLWPWSLTSDLDLLHEHRFCHWLLLLNELGRKLLPMYTPTVLSCDTRRIAPVRALTGLWGHNNLISSLSSHLMSYICHGRNRPRSCRKVHPCHVWQWSRKNYTRESACEMWRPDRRPGRRTDTQTNIECL